MKQTRQAKPHRGFVHLPSNKIHVDRKKEERSLGITPGDDDLCEMCGHKWCFAGKALQTAGITVYCLRCGMIKEDYCEHKTQEL